MNRAFWKYCFVSVGGVAENKASTDAKVEGVIPEAAHRVDIVQLFPDAYKKKVAPIEFSQQIFYKTYIWKFLIPLYIFPQIDFRTGVSGFKVLVCVGEESVMTENASDVLSKAFSFSFNVCTAFCVSASPISDLYPIFILLFACFVDKKPC